MAHDEARAKAIGELIRQARLAANKSPQECATFLGCSEADQEAIERGELALSLPELESLAYFLDTPLEYFWQGEMSLETGPDRTLANVDQLLKLRHRMIGVLLRQARLEAGYTLDVLSERSGIDVGTLESYEFGMQPVPLPELESLSSILHRSIREFYDSHGPIGQWNAQQRAIKDFLALPLDLQLFVSKPVNRPYLELAARLNEMSVDKLRAVAEGLLEITY